MIEIKNLKKQFGSLEVLKGVNLHIDDGEVVSIIGPSGSGKSTLLRCINLLERPTSGQVFIDGLDITQKGVDIQKVKVEIDEQLLTNIANETGGRYFRATDNTKLAEIYSEIGKMEKTRTTIDSFPVYKELFLGYAVAALICLMLELLLNVFVIRRLP